MLSVARPTSNCTLGAAQSKVACALSTPTCTRCISTCACALVQSDPYSRFHPRCGSRPVSTFRLDQDLLALSMPRLPSAADTDWNLLVIGGRHAACLQCLPWWFDALLRLDVCFRLDRHLFAFSSPFSVYLHLRCGSTPTRTLGAVRSMPICALAPARCLLYDFTRTCALAAARHVLALSCSATSTCASIAARRLHILSLQLNTYLYSHCSSTSTCILAAARLRHTCPLIAA
ncbi:hypothetical protein NEOLEDRAFT_724444 [Neolentinus lepideus HHB14362 ss-1]|uniref:Uncharacterized protein n=1 Tax=Neolentinus lepideus HHB14362 ss-1 TaxID=1314782 RepID=A0A165Q3L3_9AGAM|nr:hypothetical protein NEOLEDRAFT_724444 [Neolentinus lepideus HHB14362 ss-1]